MNTKIGAIAGAVYNSLSTVGRGISGLYNEAVGANMLARNGAQADCDDVFGRAIFDFEGEALNTLSRHAGFWMGAALATGGAIIPAAAVYTAFTSIPTLYRMGRVAHEDSHFHLSHEERALGVDARNDAKGGLVGAVANAVYQSLSKTGRGISAIYNEAVGANMLARNGAQADSDDVFGRAIFDFEGEALNTVSRHVGFWMGAALATGGAVIPAAAAYTALTVVPTLFRLGKFSLENAAQERAREQTELKNKAPSRLHDDIEPTIGISSVPKVPRSGAFAKSPRIGRP